MTAFDAAYYRHAAAYAEKPFWAEEARRVMNAAAPMDGAIVLDFGCNDGRMADWIRVESKHARVLGVDVNEAALELGRAAHPGVRFLERYEGRSFPLPDRSVDVVVSLNTLGHVDDPQFSLSEIRRVLAPYGMFVCVVPNRSYYRAADPLGRHPGDPTIKWEWSPAKLSLDLFAHGLRAQALETFGRRAWSAPWLRARILATAIKY